MPKENPYAARVAALSDDEFTELAKVVSERRCRDEHGFGTFAEAAALYRPNPACPSCGLPAPFKDGWNDSGLHATGVGRAAHASTR